MYGREYGDQVLTFEASGGLIHSALVMQDRETKSYWALMAGEAIAGEKLGTRFKHLPYGEKIKWQDWLKKHPDTLVLSVNGRQDAPDAYSGYYILPQGYRGAFAKDNRLRTKAPVFAFALNEKKYAVRNKDLRKGRVFTIGKTKLFLYRSKKSNMRESTTAYFTTGEGFKLENKIWIDLASNCVFNPDARRFEGDKANCPKRLVGFDTFWYTWSLTNPDTEILK